MSDSRYSPPNAYVADIVAAVSLKRPGVVTAAVWLLGGQIILDLPGLVSEFLYPPPEDAAEFSPGFYLAILTVVAIFNALAALFTWMAFKGRNWARFTLLAMLICILILAIAMAPGYFDGSALHATLSAIQIAMNLAGVALLFSPPANAWYQALREAR